ARDEAGPVAQEPGRDEIAAAAGRKELDQLGVRRRDQENGEGGRDRQEDRQVPVLSERQERFFRTIGGRRKAVRAEADPRQDGRERDLVEDLWVEGIELLAEEDSLYPAS